MKEIKNLSLNKVLSLTFLSLSFFIIPMQSQAEEITNQRSAEAQAAFEQAEKYRTTTNNYRAILRWYKKAAKLDHAEAQFQLWQIYEYDLFGKKKNRRKAQKWLIEAAKNGHPKAQFTLANAYEKGEFGLFTGASIFEIKLNALDARYWYEQAAKQGHPEAQNRFKEIIEAEEKEQKKIEAERALEEALKLAEENILEKNFKEAIKILENLAYNKNYTEAQFKLAYMYQYDFYEIYGIEKNLEKAKELFLKAAEHGHREAQFILGSNYLYGGAEAEGQGLAFDEKDLVRAKHWLKKAADQGHAVALRTLEQLKCHQSFASS